MSKIQTKINFLEKKKISARLQEKSKKNQIKQSNKNNDRTEVKSNDKENDFKVKLLRTQNPTVLIYRSPFKSGQNKNIMNVSEKPEVKLSPLKREVISPESIAEESDLHISPSKENPYPSKTPTEDRKELNLRKSPRKKDTNNPLHYTTISPRSTAEDGDFQKSPSMENLVPCKTPTKDRKELNLRKSPRKKDTNNSLHDINKENNESCAKKSPLKRRSPSKNEFKGEESSPPKQKCTQEETPSQMITKLVLESPERKQELKHRKELFPKGDFDEACIALHSSAPTKLPGREDKLEFIKEFLIRHSEEKNSGTLYISGPPGTGKTASVNVAISEPQIAEAYKIICLNCTSLTTSRSIYSRIVNELRLKVLGSSEKAALTAIEKHLESSRRRMILIVLDELDQLCNTKQSVLYSVFEWPSRKNARLVLIGIANALDLTDRVLPRLQAHLTLQPTVVHFPSYSRQQIMDIIADRLKQAGVEAVFSSATLQLLAGKVAAVNGDVRRALDIARRVVEVAEKRSILQPISNNGTTKQTVAMQEVMAVINNVYNTAQTLDSSESSSFPLQQKLLICSLLLIRQTSTAKDITIGKLHEVYKKVCDRRNLSALDMSEFISLTSLVEARGIIKVTGKSHNRLSKVILQWDEGEVKNTLQDKQLLAAVLSDRGIVS